MNGKVSNSEARLNKVAMPACPVFLLAILVVAVGLMPSTLKAQTFYGTIVGTITDTQNNVVPGATVTVTDLRTNSKRTVEAGTAGDYRVVDLVPSNYEVEVQAISFKTYVQQPVLVEVSSTVRVDAKMQVGTVTETVTVNTAPPLLPTDSGTLNAQIEGQVVDQMPLNGRNIMNLAIIAPGVVGASGTAGSAQLNLVGGTHTQPLAWGNYEFPGAQVDWGAEWIDGAPLNSLGDNVISFIPSQDAIQEFNIIDNAIPAEYGRFGGGVIEMTTKSGSNAFHATMYEYLRNTVLNANNFFTNNAGLPRLPYHQNQYGVAGGGPIKKDKAFFFFGWENFHLGSASTTSTNMPGNGTDGTTDMVGGVFAKPIKDPTGKCPIEANTPQTGEYTIPQSCFDATSVDILKYLPPPNSTANPSFNYVKSMPIGDTSHQYNSRVDYNLSDKQQLFARYTYFHMADLPNVALNDYNGYPTLGSGVNVTAQQAVLGYTLNLTPSTVFDTRLSYTSQKSTQISVDTNKIDEADFGPAYAALSSEMSYKMLPTASFSGKDSIFSFTNIDVEADQNYGTYSLDPSLTKIMGKHSLKFGGEVRLGLINAIPLGYQSASTAASYSNTYVGDEVAAFMLGQFTSDAIETVTPTTTFNWSQALFAQDTWQVDRNLTLNLGLRWELPGGMEEKKNRASVLLPNLIDPVTGFLGAQALVDSPEWPSRSMTIVKRDLLGPRIGFAQRLGASTVIRGGYSMVFLSPDVGIDYAYVSPVASAVTTVVNSNPASPVGVQSDPFPATVGETCNSTSCPQAILEPTGRTNPEFAERQIGQVVAGPPVPTSKYPNMQQWNLTLSRQWKWDWVSEVSYVGVKGTHLSAPGSDNAQVIGLDQLNPADYDSTTGLATTGADAGLLITAPAMHSINAACAAWGAATGKTPTVGQCLRPMPEFQDYQDWNGYNASSSYNALMVVAKKRILGGGILNLNYVWSKIIGDTDSGNSEAETKTPDGVNDVGIYQNFDDMAGERSILTFNVAARFIASYVLDLPFGKGQRFANTGGVINEFVGGWALNGITTLQSGFPLPMIYTNSSNVLTTNFGAGQLRPDYVAGCNKKEPGSPYQRFIGKDWFNTACFTFPGQFAFGNEPRVDGTLRQQGVVNFDFAAGKSWKIKERSDLDFKAEFFNLFNHPQFFVPGREGNGANYAQSNSLANNNREVQVSLRLSF